MQNPWQYRQYATWLQLLSSFFSSPHILISTRIVLLALLSGLWQFFRASRSQSSSSTYLPWFKPLFHVEGRWFPSKDQSARGIAMYAILRPFSACMLQKFHRTGWKKKMQIPSFKQNAVVAKVGLILFVPVGLRVQAFKRRALGVVTSKETSRSLCMWSLHTTCSYGLCDCLILVIIKTI